MEDKKRKTQEEKRVTNYELIQSAFEDSVYEESDSSSTSFGSDEDNIWKKVEQDSCLDPEEAEIQG